MNWQRVAQLSALLAALLFVGPVEEDANSEPSCLGRLCRSFLRPGLRGANHCKVSPLIWDRVTNWSPSFAAEALGITMSSRLRATWLPHRHRGTSGASRPDEIPELCPTLAATHSLPLVHAKGQVYGVPFMWGPRSLIYDTTVFPQPPDSVGMFFGILSTAARFRCGTISRRYIWPRRFWVMTNPIPRNSIT